LILSDLKTRSILPLFGEISASLIKQIKALDNEQLKELGKALLDFSTVANLEQWLKARPKPIE